MDLGNRESGDKTDLIFLLTVILTYTSVFTFLSYLRYADFYTFNWDLGINQQLLWSGSHGYLLYESANYVHAGQYSFLEIHSTFIALGISWIYYVFPSAITLFVIQSLVISACSVPLLLIVRDLGLKRHATYLVVVFFLLNFGTISALFYDFHWEAFIPLEFFSAYYFMSKKRYFYAFLVSILGIFTLEVFPFLFFGLTLFFLSERQGLFRNLIAQVRTREVQILAIFLVWSVLSYVLIRFLQNVVIPILVHQSYSPSDVTAQVSMLFVLSVSYNSLAQVSLYWMLLYLSVGFIALLYPRHLLLSLPWLVNTFLIMPSFAAAFGNQYAFIALPPVFIGFIHGFLRFRERWTDIFPIIVVVASLATVLFALSLYGSGSYLFLSLQSVTANLQVAAICAVVLVVTISTFLMNRSGKWLNFRFTSRLRIFRKKSAPAVALLGSLILLSLVLSPLNTNNFNATNMPGYLFTYSYNNEFRYVGEFTSIIPDNSTVLASDNLFPYVANNVNAFSLYWFPFNRTNYPYFPYNSTNLPEYVFVDASYYFLPAFLERDLKDSSTYGLVMEHPSNEFPGTIYLYQLGYTGPTKIL